MTTQTILLRNTVSRVTSPFEENYAKRLLADPHYGKILEVVDSEKPEVLGQPRIAGQAVDDSGDPIDDNADAALGGQAEAQVVESDETAFGDDEPVTNEKED